MKFARILALLLAAILCLGSFTACLGADGDNGAVEDDEDEDDKKDKDDKDEEEEKEEEGKEDNEENDKEEEKENDKKPPSPLQIPMPRAMKRQSRHTLIIS